MQDCNILPRSFYQRPTLDVAKDLLGKVMVFAGYEAIITETEAYIGKDDPACHAAKGMTKRNEVMFGPAGHTYVYFIYGMYHCLNFVTEEEGFPAAVLIRGVELKKDKTAKLNGPGKLCRFLGIDRSHNNIDICQSKSFFVKDEAISFHFKATPRIGIKQGLEHHWRFVKE